MVHDQVAIMTTIMREGIQANDMWRPAQKLFVSVDLKYKLGYIPEVH